MLGTSSLFIVKCVYLNIMKYRIRMLDYAYSTMYFFEKCSEISTLADGCIHFDICTDTLEMFDSSVLLFPALYNIYDDIFILITKNNSTKYIQK